jgi:hypothetical protein
MSKSKKKKQPPVVEINTGPIQVDQTQTTTFSDGLFGKGSVFEENFSQPLYCKNGASKAYFEMGSVFDTGCQGGTEPGVKAQSKYVRGAFYVAVSAWANTS